MRCTELSVFL